MSGSILPGTGLGQGEANSFPVCVRWSLDDEKASFNLNYVLLIQ